MSTGDMLMLVTVVLGMPSTVVSLLAILDWLKQNKTKVSGKRDVTQDVRPPT